MEGHGDVPLGNQIDRADFPVRRIDEIEDLIEPTELLLDPLHAKGELPAPLVADHESAGLGQVDPADLETAAVGVQPQEFKRSEDFPPVRSLTGDEVFGFHTGNHRQATGLGFARPTAQNDTPGIDQKRSRRGHRIVSLFRRDPGNGLPLGDTERHGARKRAGYFRAVHLR